MNEHLEYCFACCEPTGRAGNGDDSIYIEHLGPFCEFCYATAKSYFAAALGVSDETI